MNEEYFKEGKRKAMTILSKQPKMSLEEKKAQMDSFLGRKNTDGNPYQEKTLEPQENENPET